jgi:hypothetical protein
MAQKKNQQADPSAKVAETTSEGTYAGQVGEIREMPEDRKPDPTTIAHEQVLPEDSETGR